MNRIEIDQWTLAASRRRGLIEDVGGSFVVKASNERPLVFIYYHDAGSPRSLARLLSRDAAGRIAAGIAKLPEFLRKVADRPQR